jgi:CNT family concentrative nucleoside transporter
MNQFFKALLVIFIGHISITAQELEKTWLSQASESKYTTIEFDNGEFKFSSNSQNSLQGDYMYQNNLLVLYHNDSINSIKRYKISILTDSTLVFSGKDMRFNLVSAKKEISTLKPVAALDTIVPSQGFSITSLWRGLLGMAVLIFIAFLFSSNRKAINWKTVGIGLAFQLLIAIGVLRVGFVKAIFEWIGGLFVSVLDFTRA